MTTDTQTRAETTLAIPIQTMMDTIITTTKAMEFQQAHKLVKTIATITHFTIMAMPIK